jgi:hypothetical protein
MDSPGLAFLARLKNTLYLFSFGNICKIISWILVNCLLVSTNIWIRDIMKMTTFACFSTCYLFYG